MSDNGTPSSKPDFDARFQETLEDLLVWRRVVRRFRPDPVPKEDIKELLRMTALSPSVGNAQPWRFVLVNDAKRRKGVIEIFEDANADALKDYDGERAETYASLKLSGLRDAPAVGSQLGVDGCAHLGHKGVRRGGEGGRGRDASGEARHARPLLRLKKGPIVW